jgi:hypothetical protein
MYICTEHVNYTHTVDLEHECIKEEAVVYLDVDGKTIMIRYIMNIQ